MTIQEIFPLKGYITQEIIDKARIHSIYECIGALTLRETLDKFNVSQYVMTTWGNLTGTIWLEGINYINVKTQEEVRMIHVDQPQEVTFILE